MTDVTRYLVEFLLSLAAFLFVLRFLLQLMRADFYNPICQAIVKITDPVLKPLRLVLPGIRNFDTASFVASVAVYVALTLAHAAILGQFAGSPWQIGLSAVLQTILLVLFILRWSIIIGIVASFVAPGSHHPALGLIHELTEPVLAPARRLLPPIGGLDLSPILVFLMIGLVETALPNIFRSLL